MTDDGGTLCLMGNVADKGPAIGLVSLVTGAIRTIPTEHTPVHLQIEPCIGDLAIYGGPAKNGDGHRIKVVDLDSREEHDLPLHDQNGHFAWLGPKGKVYTGSIFGVNRISACDASGDEVQTIVEGTPYFWHPGCDPSGEWIVSDTNWPDDGLWLINTVTRKMKRLCSSGSSNSHPAWSHPHPCVAPGGTTVVFNSDRTGVPHIYAARVPDEMRAELRSE